MENYKTVQELFNSINFSPLRKAIFDKIGVDVEIYIADRCYGEKYFGLKSVELIRKCGIMALALNSVTLQHFNSKVFADYEQGNYIGFWMTLYLRYTHLDGGINGINVADVRYDNGNWVIKFRQVR